MPTAVSRSLFPADLISEQYDGATLYVDSATKQVARNGLAFDSAYSTIQAAVTAAVAGDRILIAPGDYVEDVVIPNAKTALTLIAIGTRLGTTLGALTANGVGLTVKADDVTLVNLDVYSNGTGTALVVTGRRFHAMGCKLENSDATGTGLKVGPGTVANVAASVDENGSDTLFEDCEIAWAATGVILQASDYGATTQNRFKRCVFHNLSAAAFEESNGSGGAVAVHFRNLEVTDCVFDTLEDGTVPTKFISLNDDNGNTGVVSGCRFPVAINSGKNLASTKLIFVGCYFTGGVNAAQPS